MRGTFANIRIKNQMVPGVEGGVTVHYPDGEQMAIYDAAMKYEAEGTPLVIFAGDLYGNGSSRDWAAKGTVLLGVRAVIAGSFERIHRSNLIGMGVLPLEFDAFDGHLLLAGQAKGLGAFAFCELQRQDAHADQVGAVSMEVKITREDGTTFTANTVVRIDTENELDYYRNGGILHYVLRNLARGAA